MRRGGVATLAIACALLSTAATPGDVGGCGKTATALDRTRYALGRKSQDCEKCKECSIATARCARACDPAAPPDIELPVTCKPLFQDGVVCLHALSSASCSTFETYVDDEAPAIPSECNFCRIPPEPPPAPLVDGGLTEGGT